MIYLYNTLQLISAVGEVYMCFCFVNLLADRELIQKHKRYIYGCSLAIGALIAINREMTTLISYMMLIVESILILVTLIKLTKSNKIFCFSIIIAYNVCLALIQLLLTFGLLAIFPQIEMKEIYILNGIYKSICCLLSLTGVSIMYKYIRKNQKTYNLKRFRWVFLIYGTAGVLAIMGFQNQLLVFGRTRSIENMLFLLMLIGTTLLLLIGTMKSLEVKTELEILGLKSKLMEENYNEISKIYQDFSATNHDIKNHLIMVEHFCMTGQIDAAINYMDKIQEPIRQVRQFVNTGNEVMDIILNYKLSCAEKSGVSIYTKMDFPTNVSLTKEDLCSILSNLLDNAIEACNSTAVEDKWIQAKAKTIGDMFSITITNSYSGSLNQEKGEYKSLKSGLHGYGLKAVKEKVEKYGGDVKLEHKDKVFTARITFWDIRKVE